ncbi:MAG TPA: efflux RND transporter periplasmic adaptor subunit, partial [Byssovorax sp.]
ADIVAQGGNVEQAKAQLDAALVNLKYTNIVSPVDGTVISRSVDVGQTVAASLQAPVLFVIAEDLRKMQVDTSVAEGDVGKLEAGATATFVVDAFPNDRFTGKVRQIRNSATNVQNVVTYDAVLDVANTDLRLRPGMTANVTFVYAEKDDVLEVPNAALRFRPSPALVASLTESGDGAHRHGKKGARAAASAEPADAEGAPNPTAKPEPDKRAVWVLRGGAVKRVAVRTGVTDGTASEVLDGALQVGDEVIIDTLTGAKPAPTSGGGRMPRMF